MIKINFYNQLLEKRNREGIPDSEELQNCIKSVIGKLSIHDTDTRKPGILLGKIQSGKTRAFISIIALALDNGYDFVIILTKGTKPLSEQTLKRLSGDFKEFIDDKIMQIHDIMTFPKNLTKYELNQKLIIVAKKEINNLNRIITCLSETYPDLKNKKLFIIDDEADFASLSFYKNKETGEIEQGAIANRIDELRNKVAQSDFLQVTATPYSLYLQPDNYDGDSFLYLPKRPAFTEILPEYKNYVGGDYYFLESDDEKSPASCLFGEVPIEEVELLKAKKKLGRADRRSIKIEEVFDSQSFVKLRKAIMNFIVGGCMRRIQQERQQLKKEDYAFLVHTEIARVSHSWQEEIVNRLSEELIRIFKEDENLLSDLITESHDNLKKSIELTKLNYDELTDFPIPTLEETKNAVFEALEQEMLLVQKVNSDEDVKSLLDENGQLKLRTPLNIFIGGQILDRGITIKNLIGFYYGRSPKRFQQDTVLQHSRMYGARSKEDLAVTRFYTTGEIYETMKKINEFDNALREAFLKGAQENGVYFIRKDEKDKILPCSPNKIIFSNITTLRPYKRLLPTGFNTDYKTKIRKDIFEIDGIINNLLNSTYENKPTLINIDLALNILDRVSKTLIFEKHYNWDLKSHKASLEFLSRNTKNESLKDKVWCLVRKDRNLSRLKADGSFSNQPDNPETDLPIAREFAEDIPILILLRENGLGDDGWRDSPFWWPVIIAPKYTHITIFSSDIKEI